MSTITSYPQLGDDLSMAEIPLTWGEIFPEMLSSDNPDDACIYCHDNCDCGYHAKAVAKSSTFIDAVHDQSDDVKTMAPAQLYSTMSGRLFHSGRIAIVLVGPPARGKT
jgi:hypothetical protein